MFAAGGILPWHQTQPGRELAPTAEAARFYHRGGEGCGDDRADARNARQALADRVALVPGHMLHSRAQAREVGRRGKLVGIDEKRRIQIGGRDLNAATALWPEESQAYRETLIGPDFRDPDRRSAQHSVQVWTIDLLHASKEKMAARSRCGNRRLRFGDEAHQEAMVLKSLADAGEIAHNGDAIAA